MKKIFFGALLLSLLDACVVPINSSYESARMLEKGGTEFMGHYTHYSFSDNGESDAINNNFGIRIGYGITDKVDVKLRYIRLVPVEEGASGINYIDVAPKVGIVPDWFAAALPIGLYFAEDETEFVISPKLLFTYPAGKRFEATLATKADIFPEDDGNVYLGLNLGLGLSQNLDKWALRPELGLMVDPGESGLAFSFGIGLTAALPGRNRTASR